MTAPRPCPLCEATCRPVTDVVLTLSHAGLSESVSGLSGWQCETPDCAELHLDDDSQRRYAAASDALVLAARRANGQELRRIRRKLKLTQAEAARLTGGGHNGFSRYEKGLVQPLPAVMNLFRLLDRHPDMLGELLPDRQVSQAA